MNEHVSASPLTWPEGWKRSSLSERSRFENKTVNQAVNFVLCELERMGVPSWNVIISSNLKLRNDGLPYSSQRAPEDKGTAVWWKQDDVEQVIALDKYDRISDNIYAIGKTIEAMRGIKRWGGGEILDRTFAGFTSLPHPDHVVACGWRDVLEYYGSDILKANKAYKIARGKAHPDNGGTNEKYHEVNLAWSKCERELLT